MSKFRKFLALQEAPSVGFKPPVSTARTLGHDPGLGQLNKPPEGGWNNISDFAHWKVNQIKGQRIFDLRKLAAAMGVNQDKAQTFIDKFSSQYGQPLSWYAAETYLRDLKNRTDSARMVLADEGTTPSDPDLSARLQGAHFKNQGPTDNGNEPYVDQNIIEDLDKRLYTGEVSGRGGGVVGFEMGSALGCITPAGERSPVPGTTGRYDIHIPLVDKAMFEFSQMESNFSRGLGYALVGAGAATAAWHKMTAPSTGVKAGHDTDAFAPGTSAF